MYKEPSESVYPCNERHAKLSGVGVLPSWSSWLEGPSTVMIQTPWLPQGVYLGDARISPKRVYNSKDCVIYCTFITSLPSLK